MEQSQIQKQSEPNFIKRVMNSQNKEYVAYGLIFLSSFFWVYLWVYPNQHNFSSSQTNLIRGIAMLIIPYFLCRYFGFDSNEPKYSNYYWLNLRNGIMIIFAFSMSFVQFVLPLPIVHTITASGNIFIFFWDYYLYSTTITSKQLKGIVIGLVGVVLLINGRIILSIIDPSYESSTQFQNYKTKNPIIITLVGFLFTGIVFVWGYAIVITKKLQKVNSTQINFHQGILVTLSSALIYPFYNNGIDTYHMLIALLVSGFPGIIGQLMFIAGITLSKNTGILTMINFSCVIWAYLVSIFRYGESQNILCSFGVVLVVVGISIALFSKKTH